MCNSGKYHWRMNGCVESQLSFFCGASSGAVTRVIVRVDGRVTVSSSGQLIIGILQNECYIELRWWQQKGSTQEPLCVSIMSHSQTLHRSCMRLQRRRTCSYLLYIFCRLSDYTTLITALFLFMWVRACSTRPWWCAVSVSFKAAHFNHKCWWTIKLYIWLQFNEWLKLKCPSSQFPLHAVV